MKTVEKGCFKAGGLSGAVGGGNFTNKNDLKETFLNWKFSELKYSMSASEGCSQLEAGLTQIKAKRSFLVEVPTVGGLNFIQIRRKLILYKTTT